MSRHKRSVRNIKKSEIQLWRCHSLRYQHTSRIPSSSLLKEFVASDQLLYAWELPFPRHALQPVWLKQLYLGKNGGAIPVLKPLSGDFRWLLTWDSRLGHCYRLGCHVVNLPIFIITASSIWELQPSDQYHYADSLSLIAGLKTTLRCLLWNSCRKKLINCSLTLCIFFIPGGVSRHLHTFRFNWKWNQTSSVLVRPSHLLRFHRIWGNHVLVAGGNANHRKKNVPRAILQVLSVLCALLYMLIIAGT